MKNYQYRSIHMEAETIIDKCPNCEDPNEDIPPMPNGNCGVCGGTGFIEWKPIVKLIENN